MRSENAEEGGEVADPVLWFAPGTRVRVLTLGRVGKVKSLYPDAKPKRGGSIRYEIEFEDGSADVFPPWDVAQA